MALDLTNRPRRLRRTPGLRALVRETHLEPSQFIYPLFVCPGEGVRKPIGSMPGVAQMSVDEIVNGFVFNFESPGQIVARRMALLADGLPDDWLQRYLAGIQKVSPEDIRDVFARNVRPDDMVILVLGDPTKLDEPLDSLGPVTELTVEDGASPRAGG